MVCNDPNILPSRAKGLCQGRIQGVGEGHLTQGSPVRVKGRGYKS